MIRQAVSICLKGGILLAALCGPLQAQAASQRDRCANARDLTLVNGRIVTMDPTNPVASSVVIRDGRIVSVGRPHAGEFGACMKVIDLEGRTAVPGLVDNHNHIVLLGIRPGFDTRLESAASIADVQAAIRARAAGLVRGDFITAIGGWNPAQFAEKRLPTRAELDAAAPDNPVYVQLAFLGPSVTNTSGKAFFEARGVTVGDDGSIGFFAPSVAALDALRAVQTLDDQKRGTLDAMRYGASLGLTTHFDMGGFINPGTPNTPGSFVFPGAASWNPYTAYDAALALQREDRLPARLRLFYLSMDTQSDNPILTARLLNAFREFGGDMMKGVGVGEFITNWPLFGSVTPTNYPDAVRAAARRGWIYQQHSLSLFEDKLATSTWETLNSEIPIADLHWSLAHVPFIDQPTVGRLKNLGGGIAVHGWRYLAGTPTQNGPPYRMIVDSGIHAGAGSDSAQISALNPWLNIYYMVTGRNSSGELINPGQTLTRAEALRLYTAENGWFAKEERLMGSIEVGKYGDIAVLSDDFLNPRRVSDEGIKRMSSVLTVVGGRVVHDAGALRRRW